MINVLFVCLGNICRSPMGEAVLRNKIKNRGLESQILVDSAGTGDWHIGHQPHEGTRKLLDERGISYEGMVARQVTSQDFIEFDYVICMDQSNLTNLRKLIGGDEATIVSFMDLLPSETLREVPDPYYTGNFEEVYALMDAGCAVLLDKIVSEKL
ncbi:low molecular weight protein-tyrosine-phosphatase [Paenibacillus crassostreae]|uniref:protein-tyrosine-phosphatase n=1 Tax=Paenibacillus crassostreae TaxID=1763538 RepID=A0A167DSZ5_9BACL|nr:low molecular weight protein-tyrosine-phosphatase [Paenibacillus crassostreae]AOZ91096.1 phosphotyrosine protein phosphatase [Paenibacillus crassostreae]OAB74744.1 phosphotyrosine protein phosphatase [Paenibacillus crassostreae]